MEGLAVSLGYDRSCTVSSSGRSGGLCVFWKNYIQLEIKNESKCHIDCVITEPDEEQWRLTCFYVEANRSLRYLTWDMMKFLRSTSTLVWACIGDFNECLRSEEQLGPNERDTSQIAAFREAVDLCALSDIGYSGVDWTFEKKVRGGDYCRVRPYCVLATAEWSERFPFASVEHLTAVKSDHCPILLVNEMVTNSVRTAWEKPFRYECMWESHGSFEGVLEEAWNAMPKCSNVSAMTTKLASVAASLKDWNANSFGAVRQEI